MAGSKLLLTRNIVLRYYGLMIQILA